MRIAIDYTAAVRQTGGIGRYTRNLIRALSRLDEENQYTLLVAGGWGGGDGLGSWPENFRTRTIPLSDRWLHILWQRFRLPVPVQAFSGPVDLFHSPDFVLPPTGRAPAILTIHDLSFLRVPECYVPAFRRYLEGAVKRAVDRADWILADSESTHRDLVELMAVETDRVTVLYPGVESRFEEVRDPAVLERVRAEYGLPHRFVMGLSTLQPRKNFPGLVEGFRRLLRDHRGEAEFEDVQLVIVGGKGWMYEETLAAATKAELDGRVHLTGFAQDSDLPAVYSLAEVFAFPSWYEGFGLPVIEAMSCGTPVISADNSSLPEVVGEAGLLVDAADPNALASALARVLADEGLRSRLKAAGLQQAQRFRWSAAAEHLLALYQAVGQ